MLKTVFIKFHPPGRFFSQFKVHSPNSGCQMEKIVGQFFFENGSLRRHTAVTRVSKRPRSGRFLPQIIFSWADFRDSERTAIVFWPIPAIPALDTGMGGLFWRESERARNPRWRRKRSLSRLATRESDFRDPKCAPVGGDYFRHFCQEFCQGGLSL